jgi:hypothetical protein
VEIYSHASKLRGKMKTFLRGLIACMAAFSFLSGGAGAAAPTVTDSQWVTPLELDFGPVGVGETGSQMVATITNSGTIPLTGWAGGGVNSPFSASQDCNITGGVLPGHSCHYFFGFSTTSSGVYTATSTSSTNAGQISVKLTGAAHPLLLIGGGQQVSPLSLDFGPVGIGATVELSATITNNDNSNITGWAGGGVNAPFSASQDCNIAGGLPPGASCHYYFSFHPTSPGTFTTVSSSNDSIGPFSISIQGTGVAPSMRADALWLDFGPVNIGHTPQQVVTITNTGLTPLTGWAGGGVPAPFSGSQDCNIAGGVLPGDSCHFFYTFSPTAIGSFSTTSSFSTNAGTINIKLQGQGLEKASTSVFLPSIYK